jgi:predicted oxidoreductase
MRWAKLDYESAQALIETALDNGISFFDFADIYGSGKSEEIFGEVLSDHPTWRDDMIIQSKCAIRPGYYDLSKEHILESVDKSLERLQTDHLDVLLLHRPDVLMDPAEVGAAFDILKEQGKVRYFGVSNMNSSQIELLQQHSTEKILFNQLQFSLVHAGIVGQGMYVNTNEPEAIDRDGGILEYCTAQGITIQAWSPLQASFESWTFIDNPHYKGLNEKLELIGNKYGLSPAAVAIAWILRHPADIRPILGTTNPEHLLELVKATTVELTKKEWYELYIEAGHQLP